MGSSGSGSDDSSSSENPFCKRKSSNESDHRSPKRPTAFFSHHPPSDKKLPTHSSPMGMHSPSAQSGELLTLEVAHADASTLAAVRSGPPPTRRPSLQDLVHHSIPVSSERQSAQTPPPTWHEEPPTRASSRPPHYGPRGTRTPDSWSSQHEDGVFMQENGALGYGSLAVEGPGDESGRELNVRSQTTDTQISSSSMAHRTLALVPPPSSSRR